MFLTFHEPRIDSRIALVTVANGMGVTRNKRLTDYIRTNILHVKFGFG